MKQESADHLRQVIYSALSSNVDQRLTPELATGLYNTINAHIETLIEKPAKQTKATPKAPKKAPTNGKLNRTAGASKPAN